MKCPLLRVKFMLQKAKKKANKVSLEKPQVIPKKQLQADQYRRERVSVMSTLISRHLE